MATLKSNFTYNLLLTFGNLLFPIISFPYVSRVLGPEGLGKAQFVITFAQYFVLISAFGIPIYGLREVAKARYDKEKLSKLFSELLSINFIFSVCFLVIYITIVSFSNWFYKDITLYWLAGLLIMTGFTSIDWFYSGIEEFKYISIRSISIKFLLIFALFYFVKTPEDLIYYLILSILSVIANNIWNFIQIHKKIHFRFRNVQFQYHLPVLVTFFLTSISISIYTVLDTLLLGFIANETSVGYYTAAIRLSKLALPLIVSLGIVLIPKITEAINAQTTNGKTASLQKYSDTSFAFICLIGIPISIGLFIYSRELIIIYAGYGFSKAIPTMQILSPIIFLVSLGHIFGLQLLIPSGNEKSYLIATVFGLVISLFLNLALIPSFSDKGAAIATLLAEATVSIVSYYYVRKHLRLVFNWRLMSNAAISSIIFIPIAVIFRSFHLNLLVTVLGEIFFSIVLYIATQMVFFKEKLIRDLIQDGKSRYQKLF